MQNLCPLGLKSLYCILNLLATFIVCFFWAWPIFVVFSCKQLIKDYKGVCFILKASVSHSNEKAHADGSSSINPFPGCIPLVRAYRTYPDAVPGTKRLGPFDLARWNVGHADRIQSHLLVNHAAYRLFKFQRTGSTLFNTLFTF